MDKCDLKEKLVILTITTGIFLPVRVLFASYVSEHWLGSLGLGTAFGLFFVIMIKKRQLGWFGRIFEKQMRKTLSGKTGKYLLVFLVIFAIYFGTSLYLIDRGNTFYESDKEVFYIAILEKGTNLTISDIPMEKLNGPIRSAAPEFSWIYNIDYAMSIAFAIMDESTDGWLGHFIFVVFVEQLEGIGLVWFYRKTFKKTAPLPVNS